MHDDRFRRRMAGRFQLFVLMAIFSVEALALEPVSLQLRWTHQFQFAGYYAALHKGFYHEAGLDVSLKEGGPGADPVAAVLAGESDFGISISSLVIDYLKGKPVLMLGPVFQHSPNVLLVRGENRHLSELALPGAGAVALMEGDQDVELKVMFLNEGIDLDRLQIVPDENHLVDFLNGRVEALNAYVSNEPFVLQQAGIPFSILRPQSYGMDFYGDLLFTTQALAREHPQKVAAFRAASLRGWQYALDHPDEIIDLILEHYDTQGKSREQLAYEAEALHRLINPEVIELGHSNPGRWQHIANTFARFGLVRMGRSLDEFFYQRDPHIDLTWLYSALAASLAILLVVAGITLLIHRAHRRLAHAMAEKHRSEERYRVIFQSSASAGLVWREGFIVTDWNHQAEALFGWSRAEVIGRNFMEFLLPVAERHLAADFAEIVRDGTYLPHGINDNLTRDGRIISCEWFNAWLPQQAGEPPEVISLAIDITERRRLEEQVRQLAFFDPLTRLPNRRLLDDRVEQAMALFRRHGGRGALLFIDLDNFKPLNDRYGHDVGDLLLVEVAQRLVESVRASDTVARYGGDEFVVLLNHLPTESAEARADALCVAGKLLKRLTALYSLCRLGDVAPVEHRCSASIGLVLLDGLADKEEAFRRADMAMYDAKRAGRNRIALA
jgi:diguanylate cyclase (GGDEF)-like protein/PAS domain S-box-containing protein